GATLPRPQDVRVRDLASSRPASCRVAYRPMGYRTVAVLGRQPLSRARPMTLSVPAGRVAPSAARYRPAMHDGCRIEPGAKANLVGRSTDDRLGIEKGRAQQALTNLTDRLSHLHGRLHAERSRAVLLVL